MCEVLFSQMDKKLLKSAKLLYLPAEMDLIQGIHALVIYAFNSHFVLH
jgi:hypothetical protein